MQCPRCQAQNPEEARFCEECGDRLALACSRCGAEVPSGKQFCRACGSPLTAQSASGAPSPATYTPKHLAGRILSSKALLEGERKQVTVLFADLKGSMELLADRDPEEARKLLDPVLERMMEAVHRDEGTVNQVMGDGIMALFGAPVAHEDHAVRACYAALDMQAAIRRYADEVRRSHGIGVQIRVGLNSGEVVVRAIGGDLHMDYSAIGQTTHLAARMEQLASPGSTLLTAETLRLTEGYVAVRPLGPIPVKGLDAPIDVYEMVGAGPLRSRLSAAAARGLSRFVGRESELEQLRHALGRAAAGHGQIVGIVGEAGVGKSRLVWELTHSHRTHGWLILESGSVSYGKATSYLPVIDLLKAYFKIQDRDEPREIREKVTGKLLTLDEALKPDRPVFLALLDLPLEDPEWQALDPRRRRQRTLDAVKRLVITESRVQPLLVVFEDLHWIDAETQALLDGLVESLPTARLLLVVNYRPEYRHAWGSKTYYTQLRLDPLPPQGAEELLRALLGDDAWLRPATRLLIERTEGNPFFLEESVRSLVETKVLVGERGAYRLAKVLANVQVPPTVQALLAARIDRLPPEDKRLLQAASVVGKDVPLALLQVIADLPEPDLRQALGCLQAAEFLYETRLFPDLEYTFKHALTHEVTHGSLLHERRRELHRRVGETLEQRFAGQTDEVCGELARHFVESGDLEKGLTYSRWAAGKAVALFAHDEALAQYERGRACAEALGRPDEVASVEEAIGDVHLRRGAFERAVESYERALDRLVPGPAGAALKLKIGRSYAFGDPRGLPFLHAALDELSPETQRSALAEATALIGRFRHYAGQHAEAIEWLERARRLAESLDDANTLTMIYGHLAGAYQHLAQFDASMDWARRCVELAERAGLREAASRGYTFLAQDSTWLGRWDDGLAFTSRAYRLGEQIGAEHRLAWAECDRALALHGKGELAAAAEAGRLSLRLVETTGERRVAALIRSVLSQIVADLSDDEAAFAYAGTAVTAADALGDLVMRVVARHAYAYLHLQREEWDVAARWLRERADLLAGSDNRLKPLMGLARAAEAALGQGHRDEAAALVVRALELARDSRSRHYETVARRIEGQILASAARWEESARAFDDAIVALEELGSRLELGRARYHRGLMHRTRGDATAARADLAAASVIFADLGARRGGERAEEATRRLPG